MVEMDDEGKQSAEMAIKIILYSIIELEPNTEHVRQKVHTCFLSLALFRTMEVKIAKVKTSERDNRKGIPRRTSHKF